MTFIIIEASARHCHLSQLDLEKLFGRGYQLKKLKPLSQPGQFAAQETVVFKTPGGQISNLRILGPARGQTQVELALSDAYHLKIKPPLRLSGDLKKSAGGVLVGPKGQIKLKSGVIIARRHLHLDPLSAKKLNLKNNQKISIRTGGGRSITFHQVIVRINQDFVLCLHLDLDEANAAGLSAKNAKGQII